MAREHILGLARAFEWNIRRHRAGCSDTHDRGSGDLPRLAHGVDNGACFEARVHHAVGTLFVIAGAVVVPRGVVHQLFICLGVALAEQIARALPAKDGARRIAPRRALIGLIAREKIEEQCRLENRPSFAAAAALEDIAEQLFGFGAIQKVLLIGRALISITGRYRDAVDAHGFDIVEELGNALGFSIIEESAVDIDAEALGFGVSDGFDATVVDALLAH